MNVIWTSQSVNEKTGNVPTAWIGADRAEGRASCAGCPLLDADCYAHSGTPILGAASARKGFAANPARYSLKSAIKGAARSARMIRLTGIGDIGRSGVALAESIVREAREAGLAVVGYTHHWRESEVSAAWRGRLMASTESMLDADRAVSEGWRATVLVPEGAPRVSATPAGRKVVLCPAQVEGSRVTCNDCRLCDGSRPGPIVAFAVHGNQKGRISV